ncbi:hypothetical protein SDC9_54616 [bioreactor metagenome]|uniref:Uncharacterized protein n=1 Tax=bioreactor metagenome TaxID=1076179 RepID=A0A644X2C0_9ZZZZ
MDSVSIPVARPDRTFRLPYILLELLLVTPLTDDIIVAPFTFACGEIYLEAAYKENLLLTLYFFIDI